MVSLLSFRCLAINMDDKLLPLKVVMKKIFPLMFIIVLTGLGPVVSDIALSAELTPIHPKSGLWIWPSDDMSPLYDTSNHFDSLYVLQGNISQSPTGKFKFKQLGPRPHPIKHQSMHIVLRVRDLPSPADVAKLLLDLIGDWKQFGAHIQGVQLDYDSPSSKLQSYALFLKILRSKIPRPLGLSITGLLDWTNASYRSSLLELTQSCDEIIYQLYTAQGSVPFFEGHLVRLMNQRLRFSIGVTNRIDDKIQNILSNTIYDNPPYRKVLFNGRWKIQK